MLRFIIMFWAPLAWAQTLSVGLTVGGLPAEDFLANDTSYAPDPARLLIGPTVRLRTRWGLGGEIGALHKSVRFGYAFGLRGLGFSDYQAQAAAWQFPLLLQFGREIGHLAPYVSGGPSLRWITRGSETGRNCRQLPSIVCTPFNRTGLSGIDNRTTAGMAMGAGVEIRLAWLRLSPEVRFARWLERPLSAPLANDNQIELLMRIAVPVIGR